MTELNQHEEECPALMRGRHDAELKALKEGQSNMDNSLKELTGTIKEYVALTQKIQEEQIVAIKSRQDHQEKVLDEIVNTLGPVRLKAERADRWWDWSIKIVIVGACSVIISFIWNHVTSAKQGVTSCIQLLIS